MPTPLLSIAALNKRKPKESKLTAIEYLPKYISSTGITRSRIKCLCECGNIKNAIVGDFVRGNPMSCGCVPKGVKTKFKYGGITYKRLKQVWNDLIERHINTKHTSYKYYGGKGCIVCHQWYDYDTFAEWAINNGYDNTKQLDKDIKGNGMLYSPETCCFVTALENSNNRSTSKKYQYNNSLYTLSQIALKENIPYTRLKARIYGLKKTLQQAIDMR